jgi:hypothetical protein
MSKVRPLFNAPVLLIDAPLKNPMPVAPTVDFNELVYDAMVPAAPAFEYNSGIRPSPRAIHFDSISEPANPFPTRTGTPAPAKLTFGTFKLGKKEIDEIGY